MLYPELQIFVSSANNQNCSVDEILHVINSELTVQDGAEAKNYSFGSTQSFFRFLE